MNNLKKQTFLMLIVTMGIIFFNCCDSKRPKEKSGSGLSSNEQFYVREKISDHIQSLENLSIYPADIDAPYSIKLIEEGKFGETGKPYLTQVLDCVIDDKDRVLIVNAGRPNYEQILHVFNADGSYHTQIGRHGAGPGEYSLVMGLQAKAGKIFMLDYNNQRVNEYSTEDYSIARTILLEKWKSSDGKEFGFIEPRNDGNYLLTFSDNRSKTGRIESKQVVMDHEGKEVNFEPLRFPDGYRIPPGTGKSKISTPTMPITFLGTTRTALSREDELFTNWTRHFLIKKYDSTGTYQSAIYYPILGVPFVLEDYTKSAVFSPDVREIEKALSANGIDIPDRLPVIDRLIIDDENRIWVALPRNSSRDTYEWWILKESGKLLAKLMLPRDQPIYDIKNGYLYSKKTNEETGTEYVVKYRIELTKK